MQAYEDAIATSTTWAPWYVLPADDKHVMQTMAVVIIVDTIRSLGLEWPTVSDRELEANAALRIYAWVGRRYGRVPLAASRMRSR